MPWRKGNRLRLLAEEDAPPDVRSVYDDIKRTLGLPALQLYYPALGVYPTFLKLHWRLVRDVAGSQELSAAADRLRADAYTRAHNYFRIEDLNLQKTKPDGATAQLERIVNYFHYKEPLLLLLVCFQMQAMEGPAGQGNLPATAHERNRIVDEAPCPFDEQNAPAPLKKKFELIRHTLDLPFVNPEFCAFAQWPDFFDRYWEVLKQMMASPLYDECRYGVRSTAWSLAAQLPGPAELTIDQLAEAGMTPEEVSSIARILELFVKNLSGQLLNVAAAKIALEGGNLVTESRTVAQSRNDQPAA